MIKLFSFLLPLLLLFPLTTTGQEDFPEYDELSVEMEVPGLGTVDFPIAIKGEDAYMAVTDLFSFLKIKAEETEEGIEGFIIHPDSTYQINPQAQEVFYQDEKYDLEEDDFIQSPTTLYLKANHFGEIFGLHTNFSFRTLSVALETELDLPIIKERRLAKMRENLDEVKGIVRPDTSIARTHPFFKLGMLDWGVVSTQQSEMENDNRLTLGLGSMIAGGEANLLLNYSSRVPFDSRNQLYQWRYVNNKNKVVKQMTAGRIYTRATSSLFAPVVGIQLGNSPMQNRRSFGTYTISDYTDPGWTVELYVNNVLVEFKEADASGFYSFDVPLMYGNTNVNLKFYGPWGEERVEERVINIPYNFVPKNELEYTLSAGVVENDENHKFSRLDMHYGLSNGITLGGGVEYLSEVESGEVMPFLSSSVKLAPSLMFSGEYMYGVKGEGLLSYRSPSNLQVDLNYAYYDPEQTAINYNYLEERKVSLSFPLRTGKFSMFSRLSVNQIIMPTTEFTTAQMLLSGAVMGVSTNLTTYAIYNDRVKTPSVYSTISQTYRLPYRWMFSPQVQFDFSSNEIRNAVVKLERPIFEHGFLNLGYENNFLQKSHIFEVGLRYSFNFAQTSLTSRIGNRNTSFAQSARGSLLLDDNNGYLAASNRSAVSRGGITIIPFLDYNANGKKDPMEPGVAGIELKNTSGRVVYNKDRTILRILDLQPYVDMLIELNPLSLDNIAWKMKNPRIAVETVPNQFKEIMVPIHVLGEVGGMVYFKDESGIRGQGRIVVNIFNESGERVTRILTEGDGFFAHLGLQPGKYTAAIDEEQMRNLNYTASEAIPFEIQVDEYGDIVDTLEFVITPAEE